VLCGVPGAWCRVLCGVPGAWCRVTWTAGRANADEVNVTAHNATLQDIQSFRALFLQETNFQIRYDACHARGWTDSYLLKIDDVAVGYGSIKGNSEQIGIRSSSFT
jgi:hypothetical protein